MYFVLRTCQNLICSRFRLDPGRLRLISALFVEHRHGMPAARGVRSQEYTHKNLVASIIEAIQNISFADRAMASMVCLGRSLECSFEHKSVGVSSVVFSKVCPSSLLPSLDELESRRKCSSLPFLQGLNLEKRCRNDRDMSFRSLCFLNFDQETPKYPPSNSPCSRGQIRLKSKMKDVS